MGDTNKNLREALVQATIDEYESHATAHGRPNVPGLLGTNSAFHCINFEHRFTLRLAVARHGEMHRARRWNTQGVLRRRGAVVLMRRFPSTHRFAQARLVLTGLREQCLELIGSGKKVLVQ